MKWSRKVALLAVVGECVALLCCAVSAGAAPGGYGKVTGVVLDPGGTPQMGVSVWLTPEAASGRVAARLLTDQNGIFTSPQLRPGLYSLRANLSGFLPTLQQHVHIAANLTTLVSVHLNSVFGSLDSLRQQSTQQPSERDDWKWVLRTSAATRPVMQLVDGTLVVQEGPEQQAARPERARLEMTNGSVLPGSPSAEAGTLGTAAAYDQGLGAAGRLMVAGQMDYDPTAGDAGGGAVTAWLPRGEWSEGPETIVVLHQSQGFENLPGARALRAEHAEQMTLTSHLLLKYAADLVAGGVGGTTANVRPHVRLLWRPDSPWSAGVSFDTDPQDALLDRDDGRLQSAIDALTTTPVMIWRDGQVSALQGGWHEEAGIRRSFGARASLEASAFHDFFEHQAVFGFDSVPDQEIAASLLGESYAHDAGRGGSYGSRVVYTENLTSRLEAAVIYTYAGALAPTNLFSDLSLQDALHTAYRQSVAARFAGKLPRTGTQFAASYKWIDGLTLGRQDLFGEAALGIDPYLSFTVKQHLPSFHAGHWEAICSFRNVLAQGYVPITTEDGRMLSVPVERSLQGGVSVQF